MQRKILCKELKKARTTIYDNLLKLQKKGIVSKFTKYNGIRGRPEIHWKLNNKGVVNG